MSALREGERIQNYILQSRLGAGGCGEVWRAKHHVLEEVVAIKVPTDERFARQLRREALAAHRLRHPNVVRVIDLDPYASPPYLVMELVDGPSLRTAIDHLRASFPMGSAVVILQGILAALDAAHSAGLIHRDVKPGNILLDCPLSRIGGIPITAVKVSDFGLGSAAGATLEMMQSLSVEASEGRDFAGTVAYMSPEQREGVELDARSDLYACGIVLFEMLTGERPQGSEVPSALRSDVPRGLDEVFRRCYARRDRRFESAKEMSAALACISGADRTDPAAAPGARGHRPGPPPPPPRDARRKDVSGDGVGGRCSACGSRAEPEDRYCIRCGATVVADVAKCQQCGAIVDEGDRFCIGCGSRLAEAV